MGRTLLTKLGFYGQHGSDTILSHPVLRSKLDVHRMYAQDQVVIHMVRI
jgi:hypothetical protein